MHVFMGSFMAIALIVLKVMLQYNYIAKSNIELHYKVHIYKLIITLQITFQM